MTYIVDPINNKLIDDEKTFKKKEVPVRKPGAVPPKTPTIQKFKNGGAPVKPRVETFNERFARLLYEYEDGPKPPHYDDPNIIDMENFKKPPKKFDNNDKSTFLSDRNQRQMSVGWEAIKQDAKGNPKKMKEIREMIRKAYKSTPDLVTDDEKKMIGVYKKPKAPKVELPKVEPMIPITFNRPTLPTPDPETERLKQNYLRAVEDDKREKLKNATSGLAYILGGGVPIK